MADQQNDQQEQPAPREPWVTAQDVFALAGIGLVGGGAYMLWDAGVALMVGGGLLLATAVIARG